MINLTPAAVKAVQRFIRGSETPVIGLRLTISGGGCSGLQYGMKLENEKADDDWELEVEGVKVAGLPERHHGGDGALYVALKRRV